MGTPGLVHWQLFAGLLVLENQLVEGLNMHSWVMIL